MGVAGILPRLSPIMHKIKIIKVRNKKSEDYNAPFLKSSKVSKGIGEGKYIGIKRSLAETQEENSNTFISSRSNIRVGIDIMLWISKQCHGRGATLIDDRHLTNYGRAEIFLEKKQKPHNQEEAKSSKNRGSDIESIERQQKLELEFVSDAAKSVVRNIISLKSNLGAELLVVFDGASPPIKHKCCQWRKSSRDSAAAKRDELSDGQTNITGEEFCNKGPQVVDVERNAIQSSKKIRAAQKAGAYNELHNNVVSAVMKLLRDEKIAFLVAPYEADGQLAYLSKKGLLDLIVSEDSDFIAHGVESVLYKYKDFVDREKCGGTNSGITGDLLRKSDFGATSSSFSLAKFSNVMLSVLLVAAGCDYNDSLQGIGIVTARNIVEKVFEDQRKGQTPVLQRVIQNLFLSSSVRLSDDKQREYEHNFLAALAMFRHPVVFDPSLGKCLFEGSPDPELIDYKPYNRIITDQSILSGIVGNLYSRKLGIYVAEGWINPKTWSLRNMISETPANVVKEWRKKLFSEQEDVNCVKSPLLQNTVRERINETSPHERKNNDIEVINISDQSDCEIDLHTQEIVIPPTLKTPSGEKRLRSRSAKKSKVIKVINMCDVSDSDEQIQVEEIGISPTLKSSTRDKQTKTSDLEELKYRSLRLENETKDKHFKSGKEKVKKAYLTTLQSQSSNCTSSVSKLSTQASNQSSNLSADVLSPDLLPSPLTLKHTQLSCMNHNKT